MTQGRPFTWSPARHGWRPPVAAGQLRVTDGGGGGSAGPSSLMIVLGINDKTCKPSRSEQWCEWWVLRYNAWSDRLSMVSLGGCWLVDETTVLA